MMKIFSAFTQDNKYINSYRDINERIDHSVNRRETIIDSLSNVPIFVTEFYIESKTKASIFQRF